MMTAEEARKEIVRRYNKDTRGWRFVTARDPRGYYDSLFTKDDEMWLIKEQIINPLKTVGYAVLTSTESARLRALVPGASFGLRPLRSDDLKLFVGESSHAKDIDALLSETMKSDPVPLTELKSRWALQGPVVQSAQPIYRALIDEKEIDDRLRKELEHEIKRKYRYLITPYI